MKVRKAYLKLLALLPIPFILAGCGKKADCNIPGGHVHRYVGSNNRGTIETYLDSEYENVEVGYQDVDNKTFYFERQDDYIDITDDDSDFYKAKGTMFKGEDNWEFLYSIMAGKKDFLSYQYDDLFDTYWSKELEKSGFTGKVRVYHYQFCGHKLYYKDGKWINERSPFVDDIREIIDEYPYFEIDCYKQVYKQYKFNKREVKDIKLENIDEFTGPDLENKELYNIKK